jgi:hypothetical protein
LCLQGESEAGLLHILGILNLKKRNAETRSHLAARVYDLLEPADKGLKGYQQHLRLGCREVPKP